MRAAGERRQREQRPQQLQQQQQQEEEGEGGRVRAPLRQAMREAACPSLPPHQVAAGHRPAGLAVTAAAGASSWVPLGGEGEACTEGTGDMGQ